MASEKDIVFKNEKLNVKFNFRVAALIVSKDKVLLQSSKNDDFYSLIGGRVSFFESTSEALVREISEETGVIVNEDDCTLLDVVENFFEYNNDKFHELLFIYKVNAPEELVNKGDFKTLDKDTSFNSWYDIKKINSLKILPTVVPKLLNSDKLVHDVIK